MKKNKIHTKIIAVLLSMSCITLGGCKQESVNTQEPPLIEAAADNPQLIEVDYGDVSNMTVYAGEINPYMQILQFPDAGNFEEYQVTLGDEVKKGQVIATTESKYSEEIKQQKKDISKLETEYSNTITNYTLQKQTNAWKVGQRREWIENMDSSMPGFNEICIDFELLMSQGCKIDMMKDQYEETTLKELEYQKEKLQTLEEKESANVIVAPCDGVVTWLADLKIGDEIGTKSYPVAIADLSTRYIQCDYIAPQDIEEKKRIYAIKDGKEYELTYHPYDEHELQEKSAKGEGIYTFFEFNSPDDAIQFGDTAVVIAVKEERKNVLTIPTLCLKRDGDRCFVYIQDNGERKAVDVTIGVSDKINTEILEGLKKGDYIYASN